jgi:hypothetical protein
VSKDVRGAIAAQAALRELAVPLVDDLGFVARLPKLELLELWPRLRPLDGSATTPPAPTAAELQPLRASKTLRRVIYRDTTLDAATVAALRQALGAQISLQLQ